MQVRFDPHADRILWQLRTKSDEMFAVWLTRRMVRQLWRPFQDLVGQAALPRTPTAASVMPEAREMMAQTARLRPLPGADFQAPFKQEAATKPLGPEPLLPAAIDLGPGNQGSGLAIRLREPAGRSMSLQLNADLATALWRLLEKAVQDADWGVVTAAAPAAPTPSGGPPRVLN